MTPSQAFLDGGGRAAELVRARDWSGHPLGPPEGWSTELKTAISLVLNSPESMILAWGPELHFFFNDTYFPLLGPRLPWAMGERFDKVWADGWEQARPIIEEAFAGRSRRFVDLPWKLDTDRGKQNTWWTFSYSRVLDAAGAVAGLFILTNETTARVLGDSALRESEERLRLVIEGAKDHAILTTDSAGIIDSWSAGAEATFGWKADEAIGHSAAIIFTPEDRAAGMDARELNTAAQDGCANDQRWHLTKDGRRVFMNGSVHPLPRDAEGRERGFIKVARNETERRRVDEALRESEGRYRALFEAIDDGFCIIEFIDGPDGPLSDYVHVEANPGYERHTGIRGIVGRRIRDLAPAEADGWVELYGGVLRSGVPIRFEREFVAAGRDIEVSAARIDPPSRRQVSILFRDITDRKRSEGALRASEALARENVERVQLALAAGAIIGTWVWDLPNDRFTVDEAFARAFGLDPTLGRNGLSLEQVISTVHPADKAALADAVAKAIARGGAYSHQYRVKRADGRYYWIEANGRVDHGPDGTPLRFPGVLLDVEERRAVGEERDRAAAALRALNETLELRVAERTAELMRAEEQLRQAQKMEAVGQLTGGLAHDFNNLLAGISGSLELMGTRLSQGRLADVDRYMVAAQGAAKRAAALTHRLLAFSRRQTLDPRPTNVNALVNGMTELIQRTVGPSITVETVGASGLWPALVDASQLENALLNLCINGRDAMPEGGRITIETANKWLDREAARAHDVAEGQYLSLCVTDTGTGMAPDVIAKAFEPFFTTKPLGQGTGLGLSMIYGFAKQSGGQVRIYSELGEGTTVCVYLPRHHGSAGDDASDPAKTPIAFAEAGETVLIVDDEPSIRMLVTDVLEDLGYTPIEAADSAAGLKILQSSVRVDLLITDVGLPGGMNGRQMADAARVTRPDLRVLFITGYAENSVIGSGRLDPGMEVLTKPFAVDTLAARIRELVST